MVRLAVTIGLAAALAAGPAGAEVLKVGANNFVSTQVVALQGVTPAQAYAAFVALPRWWNPSHSYSGKPDALRFEARAGGCWCETLERGGSVEHMRVELVQPGERLVLGGGLGPLKFQAVAGTMDVTFAQGAPGAPVQVTMTYRVAGFAEGNAAALAKPVDGVLAEAAARYAAFVRSSVTKA